MSTTTRGYDAFATQQVTITTTRSKVTRLLAGRDTLVFQNNSANHIYLGDVTVTVANGFHISPNAYVGIDLGLVDFYLVADVGSNNVSILELG